MHLVLTIEINLSSVLPFKSRTTGQKCS